MRERFFVQLMRNLDPYKPDQEQMRFVLHQELRGTPFTEDELSYLDTGFDIAYNGHLLTRVRESGEAYIYHPWSSAIRMIRRQKKYKTFDIKLIVESLVHDCFEESDKLGYESGILIRSSIQIRLGEVAAYDTYCVTKQKLKGETNEEYHKRLSLTDSWRALLLKPDDRLDNMWTIDSVPFDAACKKVKETEKWFPVFRLRAERLVGIEIAHKQLTPAWMFYLRDVYQELFDVMRAKKLALNLY